jgi:hypothetical protein
MRLIALDPHTMQALGAAGMNPRVSVPVDREWTATLLPSAIIWISSKRRSSEAAKSALIVSIALYHASVGPEGILMGTVVAADPRAALRGQSGSSRLGSRVPSRPPVSQWCRRSRCRSETSAQERALVFSRSNSDWSIVPASSSFLAWAICSVGEASPVAATVRT